jgi:hypothetical protein
VFRAQALSYWALARVAARNGLAPPTVVALPRVSTWLSKDAAAGAEGPTDDDIFLGDDPKG